MSVVTNYPEGTVVSPSKYNAPLMDALQRFSIEESILPCIYTGLQVTIGTGLTVNVSGGLARGQDIEFSELNNLPVGVGTLSLPTNVSLPLSNYVVTVPASSTGYIVLNVNISPAPDENELSYLVQADNNAGTPVVTPVFTLTLSPNPETSYPYTQIRLAEVVTNGSNVTEISTFYPGFGQRSFDWSQFLNIAQRTSGYGEGFVPGDVKLSYAPQNSEFWVQMDDGTIGSLSSGADYAGNGFLYAYTAIWNTVSNLWAPVVGGRGGSAAADFAANKPMMLPATVGRALCNSGTATLEMTFTANSTTDIITVGTTSSLYSGTPVTVSNSGGALPSPLVAATPYYVIQSSGTTIQLALTPADVNSNTVIDLTTNGSGTNTFTVNYEALVAGQIVGENNTQLLVENEAEHDHPGSGGYTASEPADPNEGYQFGHNIGGPDTEKIYIAPQGGNIPHNNMQPSSAIPVWLRV